MNIYVGNLPFSTTEAELQNEFGQFGAVIRAQVMIDRDTGRSRGFAFVEMANDDEARKAIESLNGKQIDGRALTVNEARPREERPRSGGGWGGGGGGGGGGRSGGGGGWSGGGGGGGRSSGGGGGGSWGGGGGGGGGRGGDRGGRGGGGGGRSGGGDSSW
ncbi:MAG: RNA-binding protein [Phycisphaerales bacterium]|nr:RNA-binding protein [Phycisphaerales bacterium]